MSSDDPRTIAARILAGVIRERITLDNVLQEHTSTLQNSRDKAFIQELCYGVLRWYPRLNFFLATLLEKPLKPTDSDLKAAMLCGIYQLENMRTPAHAAVSETVEAATGLNKIWAKSLINAVLRRFQRERNKLNQAAENSESALFSHPQWLINAVRLDWPDHWQSVLRAGNERPPMHLRVNLRFIKREAYLELLAGAEIESELSAIVPAGIRLSRPVDINTLPGFREGLVSVQDYGAQLAASLLDLREGHTVLDACAAPGGKAAHIFETSPELQRLTALEISSNRVGLLNETSNRLKFPMEVVQADARIPDQWWDNTLYDRILLDVPCSATGVIRRHPDIKLLRQQAEITQFSQTQREILESLWPVLKHKGKLVYATCSILKEENDRQIETFTSGRSDVRVQPIKPGAGWGVATKFGRQTVPGCDDMDGFYYAILEKD